MIPGLWSQHWSMGEGFFWGEISAQNNDSLLQHELFYLYWNKVSHPLLIDIECGFIISFDYLWTEMINDKAKEDWIHFCSDLHFVAFCTINILWTFLSPSLGKYCVDKSSECLLFQHDSTCRVAMYPNYSPDWQFLASPMVKTSVPKLVNFWWILYQIIITY